jgi:hypothetical protein
MSNGNLLGMLGGIPGSAWTAYRVLTTPPPNAPQTQPLWRPPQWGQVLYSQSGENVVGRKQLTSMTVVIPGQPEASVSTVSTDTLNGQVVGGSASDTSTTPATPATAVTYYFDAVLSLAHFQELRKTEHPVQSGASISDHAYLLPARVILEIGMSDVMDRYRHSDYTSDPSKSVSAYQTFLYIQSLRTPITLSTRLKTYENMVIEDIRAHEDYRTVAALRATIVLSEILQGSVVVQPSSARPQQSQSTASGGVQPQSIVSGSAIDKAIKKFLPITKFP